MKTTRLNKKIADSGITSRRKADALIEEGRVYVNDKLVTEFGTQVTDKDKVTVDGVPLTKEEPIHILYYKPSGEISAVHDDKQRDTVIDVFHRIDARLYPVGRLDYDTSGLLLVTNDGEFTQHMTHPKYEMKKTYRVKIDGVLPRHQQEEMRQGIRLEDGITAPAEVTVVRDKTGTDMILEITIHEGRNRQVKRMFEHYGLNVTKLTRISFDFLTLDGLKEGDYRFLKPHEVKMLIANSNK